MSLPINDLPYLNLLLLHISRKIDLKSTIFPHLKKKNTITHTINSMSAALKKTTHLHCKAEQGSCREILWCKRVILQKIPFVPLQWKSCIDCRKILLSSQDFPAHPLFYPVWCCSLWNEGILIVAWAFVSDFIQRELKQF